jgi:hypothetical protein
MQRSINDLNRQLELELIKWIKGMIGLQEQQNPISDEVQKVQTRSQQHTKSTMQICNDWKPK